MDAYTLGVEDANFVFVAFIVVVLFVVVVVVAVVEERRCNKGGCGHGVPVVT
jgi:hypothetical protein